jgi:hypothetical protein
MHWRILAVLLASINLPAAQDVWTGVDRVVAIGDVHGDVGQLRAVLEAAQLIDGRQRWIGGKTHLVQTGDLLDRGPDSRKGMDLLMGLEKQARKAGGRVHVLIGNHEAMNVYGDLRYTTAAEFAAFDDKNPDIPPELNQPPGLVGHRLAFGPEGKYGRWIRGLNAIVKINDTLFVHGGIGPKYADMPIEEINDRVRQELADTTKLEGGIVVDAEGPLWYRGLSLASEVELDAHVDAVLKGHGAARIVVGHTVTGGEVTPRFGGRVIRIDVGLSAHYGAHLGYFALENGRAFAANRADRWELALTPSVEAPATVGTGR